MNRRALMTLGLIFTLRVWGAPQYAGEYVSRAGATLSVTTFSSASLSFILDSTELGRRCHVESGLLSLDHESLLYKDLSDKGCRIAVSFSHKGADVRQSGACGCAASVDLSGRYKRKG